MELKHILVTGANGFVGRYLCEQLVKQGYFVHAMTKKEPCQSNLKNVSIFQWNLGQGRNLDKFPLKDIRFYAVYHLAANIDFKASNVTLIKDNVLGSAEVLCIADLLKTKKIVLVSSVGIFDCNLNKKISEKSKICCNSFYHHTKYLSEQLFLQYQENHKDIVVQIMRISAPIGRGMRTNTFLPSIIHRIRCNEDIVLYGHGLRVQNYIDIRDITRALILVLNLNYSEIFNLVSQKSYSNFDVAKLCQDVLKSRCSIVFSGNDIHENERWIFDSSKLKNKLHFQSIYTLEDSIKWIAHQNEDSSLQ